MRKGWLISVLFTALELFSANAWSQAQDDSRPAPSNVGGAQYPRIHADGRVTFRVKAPLAQKVQIVPAAGRADNNGISGLGPGPYEMTRDAEGNWTVTTSPARPGLHEYRLVIDGLAVADPNSEVYDILNGRNSAIEIPDPSFDAHLIKDVPHGQVRTIWYFSRITGKWRDALVYTPPDYDANPARRYPVLHLMHGGGQDETDWTREGHANFILDNLIATGKARPMLIVMDTFNAVRAVPLPNQQPPHQAPGGGPARPEPNTTIEEVYIKEALPYIDSHFRTIADSGHRAIAGLSGGSNFALTVGGYNIDKFSYIGLFSRAPYSEFDLKTAFNGAFTRPAEFNKKVHLFYWNTGTAEPAIYNYSHTTTEALHSMGIKTVLVEVPGFVHEWATWRRALNDFAPRLFN
jgi:enterochelin esterase family protein